MSTRSKLIEMYEAMLAAQGHQGWWPGDGALEVCVGAILTQNTNWRNVEKALDNLRAAGVMSVSGLIGLDRERLAELIRPAGYYNIKARRLGNFIAHVHESFGDDVEGFLARSPGSLREEFLGINGIGRETADSIILYAAGLPAFVVDAYTFRILFRHNLIGPDDDYDTIQELFESNLDSDVELYNDYHAQLVAVGKTYCRPRARCGGCPLEAMEHDADRGMDEF